MKLVQKTIFMISNGALHRKAFSADANILSIFFYSMLNLVPLAAGFLYFGFLNAGFVVLGVLVLLYLLVYSLIRPVS